MNTEHPNTLNHPHPQLDRYRSFGASVADGITRFRFFCPGADSVLVRLHPEIEAEPEQEISLEVDQNGVWSGQSGQDLTGWWYVYLVDGEHAYADPFSRQVTVDGSYRMNPRTRIVSSRFEWGDQDWTTPSDPRDLVIYECHVKDMVVLAEGSGEGAYQKWVHSAGERPGDPNGNGAGSQMPTTGGIAHLKALGVNAVELLPLAKFAQREPPYRIRTPEGFYNDWNRYEANHWGYMTSFFLAPESYYASDANHESGWLGYSDAAIQELKALVDTCHRHGLTVIMDVVYNHSSIFDVNILNDYLATRYLRFDGRGNRLNRSGTGNEIDTRAEAAKRLILDSIAMWMEEFHVDGFRFDLAGLLDPELWDEITELAKAVNPHAILIAEPWGGEYRPAQFSDHGWSSWNDQFRNGVKGIDPEGAHGFIFSSWTPGSSRAQLENWLRGTLRRYEGGLYHHSSHAVNYLESHDGYTLADFIRLVFRPGLRGFFEQSDDDILPLTDQELKVAKLGALALLTTPGIAMIHQGQEFANSKICRTLDDPPHRSVFLDHNSYEKDDPTNWIDFGRMSHNATLLRYYRALIRIRLESPALRKAEDGEIRFDPFTDPLHIVKHVSGASTHDMYDYIVALNGHSTHDMRIHLPPGVWEAVAKDGIASSSALEFLTAEATVAARSGLLLRRLRHG